MGEAILAPKRKTRPQEDAQIKGDQLLASIQAHLVWMASKFGS